MAAVPAVLTAAVVLSYSTVLLQVPPAVIPAAAVLAGRLADSAAAHSGVAAPPAVGRLCVSFRYIFLFSSQTGDYFYYIDQHHGQFIRDADYYCGTETCC